jgi:hypothetical protein
LEEELRFGGGGNGAKKENGEEESGTLHGKTPIALHCM